MVFGQSLSRMTSRSSIWRSWTSSPEDYEINLHNFPWLSHDAAERGMLDQELLRTSTETEDPGESLGIKQKRHLTWPVVEGKREAGMIRRMSFHINREPRGPEMKKPRETPMVNGEPRGPKINGEPRGKINGAPRATLHAEDNRNESPQPKRVRFHINTKSGEASRTGPHTGCPTPEVEPGESPIRQHVRLQIDDEDEISEIKIPDSEPLMTRHKFDHERGESSGTRQRDGTISSDIEPRQTPDEPLSPANTLAEQPETPNANADPNTDHNAERSHAAPAVKDANLVTWTGPDDPDNPLNWTKQKKWRSTLLVSCFTFISPVASTMLAPALPELSDKFDTGGFETYLIMSIFLLAYAVGPFILAPLSEMHGRVVVLQAANMVFLIFNTVCGIAQTKTQILVFRFLSGLGGAAPQALGGGVLSDCWRAEERGMAIAIYSLAPFIGPAVGPIAGGYLTQYLDWRWIFWVVSIADAVVQVLAFSFLSETYRPKILAIKAKKLRKATGNKDLYTEFDRNESFGHALWKHLKRPVIMLFTQPTIWVTGLYRAFLYGLMYLVLATFPMVWEDEYDQEPGRASLNYLSLGVGFVIGLQIAGPTIDWTYKRLKAKFNHPGRPEFRIPPMLPTAVLIPIGLFIYGGLDHDTLHWIVPNVGAAIFALGLIISFQCAQGYIVDSYETYAASATGAAAFLRTMAGFGFPLFAPLLFEEMGLRNGHIMLAAVAGAVCLAATIGMWTGGEWLRKKSQYCAG